MSTPIIASLRNLSQLHESLLKTAEELAHRASIYGVVRVSLRYLAQKCHCCKQTIINHLKLLIKYKIIRKRDPVPVKGTFYETNLYRFRIQWEGKPGVKPAQMCNGKKFWHNLPPQELREKSEQKYGRIDVEIANHKRMLREHPPESLFYRWIEEDLLRLRRLKESL